MWLGVALFVDGIDGSLARKARVREYTPNFDGASLDLVIDYFTYVAVPALMIYWFNMVPLDWLFSPHHLEPDLGRAHHGGVVLHLRQCRHEVGGLLLRRLPGALECRGAVFLRAGDGPMTNLITVLALSILTFVPVKFVHPLRVTHWRNITIPMTVLWAAMTLSLVLAAKNRADWGTVEQIELWVWLAHRSISRRFRCGAPSSRGRRKRRRRRQHGLTSAGGVHYTPSPLAG